MPLTYKETKRILLDLGFELDHQSGSHQQWMLNNKLATVPYHNEYPIKTAKSILMQIATASNKDLKELIKTYRIKL